MTPGDAWFEPRIEERGFWIHNGSKLSTQFRALKGARLPIVVVLPGGWPFCVDGAVAKSDSGWSVDGVPDRLTLSPSVNFVGHYHGYIRDGVITDDCEGRRFP
jgi:hypothetical protein